jgi:hypothetical protein
MPTKLYFTRELIESYGWSCENGRTFVDTPFGRVYKKPNEDLLLLQKDGEKPLIDNEDGQMLVETGDGFFTGLPPLIKYESTAEHLLACLKKYWWLAMLAYAVSFLVGVSDLPRYLVTIFFLLCITFIVSLETKLGFIKSIFVSSGAFALLILTTPFLNLAIDFVLLISGILSWPEFLGKQRIFVPT